VLFWIHSRFKSHSLFPPNYTFSLCLSVPPVYCNIMQFKTVAFGIFAVCALSAETSNAWIEATSFGAMLARGEAIAKRQGYTPEQRPCGTGRTCQDACGAGSVQCPSTDNKLHCHIPSTGTHCCTDGTGSKLLYTWSCSRQLTRLSRCLSNWLLLHHRWSQPHILLSRWHSERRMRSPIFSHYITYTRNKPHCTTVLVGTSVQCHCTDTCTADRKLTHSRVEHSFFCSDVYTRLFEPSSNSLQPILQPILQPSFNFICPDIQLRLHSARRNFYWH
jgi:hypothetical protein